MPGHDDRPPEEQAWWTRRWLDIFERYNPIYERQLARGRKFARDGRVLRVAVSPGLIEAEAYGDTWGQKHEIAIQVAPLPDAVWNRALVAMARRAATVAQVLAGEMPQDIEWTFSQAGAPLVPPTPAAFSSRCSCYDPGPICLHLAAVQYLVAVNLESQPWLLFALRGRIYEQVREDLSATWAAQMGRLDASPGGSSDASRNGSAGATVDGLHVMSAAADPLEAGPLDDAPPTALLRSATFFQAGPELDEFGLTIAPPLVEAALLKRLGKPPFATRDEDPLPDLEKVYAAVTRRALSAFGQTGEKRRKR
jgi:uncharacterized Zn finger protein